jgi:ribonucleoside-diphosphate reductase alpha chain
LTTKGNDLELHYTSPLFEKALVDAGLDDQARVAIVEEVIQLGSCQHLASVPEELRNAFVVAADITPEEHIYMQAAIQAFVDNSISKTCNFPATAAGRRRGPRYKLAWELGCKGLTVYIHWLSRESGAGDPGHERFGERGEGRAANPLARKEEAPP